MQNLILKDREAFSECNYVRKAEPTEDYWFDFSEERLREYVQQHGTSFSLIIAGSETVEGDFFVIPFPAIEHMLVDAYLPELGQGRRRWIGSIRHNELRIRNCPYLLDVGAFYSDADLAAKRNPTAVKNRTRLQQNDYAIENRRREVEVRQKQSLFRKRTLENFEGKCCLSGLRETDLLWASHIIPWVERINTRLDPANGLCLSILYDKLFDKGYISFNDSFEVIVTNKRQNLSDELQTILSGIEGKRMREPKSQPIKKEYLEYHRDKIFKK